MHNSYCTPCTPCSAHISLSILCKGYHSLAQAHQVLANNCKEHWALPSTENISLLWNLISVLFQDGWYLESIFLWTCCFQHDGVQTCKINKLHKSAHSVYCFSHLWCLEQDFVTTTDKRCRADNLTTLIWPLTPQTRGDGELSSLRSD